MFIPNFHIPRVAAQAVHWPGNPKVACSRLTECSKSWDLQPAVHCAIRREQGGLPCVGLGRLLLDLDPYGGTDPLGMFPLFVKRTADVMAPRLSVVFRRLVRLGSFPACWTGKCHPNSERSTVLFCCQFLTNFHNISIV